MKYFAISLIIASLLLCALLVYIPFPKNKTSIEEVINTIPSVVNEFKEIESQTEIDQPEVQELNDLVSKYINNNDSGLLIQIGDIWRKGAYTRLHSDNETAIKYYELAASSENKEVAALASAKCAEAKKDNIQEVDDVGLRLSDIYYEAIQAANTARNTERHRPVNQELIFPDVQFNQDTLELPIDDDIPAVAPLFLDDKQNVHDHYMNKITKHNLDKLKNTVKYSEDTFRLIKDVNDDNKLSLKSKAAILNVIDSFSTINKHKYFNCTEMESLNLVYLFIKEQPESKTLLHNLFLQLLDCYNFGAIVCSTGKISRVVSVVGDTIEFEDQRNIYYIKQELESLAFKVRDEELQQMSPEDVDAYNNGSEPLADQLKSKYVDIVKAEYCEKLGIQYDIISPMVEANLIGF